jgi:hypothetical protein
MASILAYVLYVATRKLVRCLIFQSGQPASRSAEPCANHWPYSNQERPKCLFLHTPVVLPRQGFSVWYNDGIYPIPPARDIAMFVAAALAPLTSFEQRCPKLVRGRVPFDFSVQRILRIALLSCVPGQLTYGFRRFPVFHSDLSQGLRDDVVGRVVFSAR